MRALSLALAFLLAACAPDDSLPGPAPATPGQVSIEDELDAASAPPPIEEESDRWSGTYTFEEGAGSGERAQTWTYRLQLQPSQDLTWHGMLRIDGFQTHKRFRVRGTTKKKRLLIVLDGYGPENVTEFPAVGETLFVLEWVSPFASSNETLITRWRSLVPNVEPEDPKEHLAFVRTEAGG